MIRTLMPQWMMPTVSISPQRESTEGVGSRTLSAYLPTGSDDIDNKWGVSVCTVDGQRFSIGDTSYPFTMQSTR